jgi:multiple sugar transport system permease protein
MIKKSKLIIFLQYLFSAIVTIFTLAPFCWLLITSISFQKDLTEVPLKLIPSSITFERFTGIFISTAQSDISYAFKIAMLNSTIIALSVTIASLIIGSLSAYAFARLRFVFRNKLMLLMLFTYMIPPVVFVIPLYLLLDKIHMLNSKTTLILLYLSFIIPFIIWVMQSYFASVSKSFEDAAAIDGCNRFQTFWHVFLPIARPGMIATGILAFLMAWDEFFLALIFTSTLNAKTISVAIAEFNGKHSVDYGMISAGGIIACLPPVIIAFIFQKYIVMGMTAGGVKE